MRGLKQKKSRKPGKKRTPADLDQLRRGMPAKDSIRDVVDFISPQKVRYKIIKTTETNVYDRVAKPKKKRGS
jgi:hypothetical protein